MIFTKKMPTNLAKEPASSGTKLCKKLTISLVFKEKRHFSRRKLAVIALIT
jgi:hypothetical protein